MSTEHAEFDWRYLAACRGHPEPWLWDESIEGRETDAAKSARHGKAKKVCREQCIVRAECEAAIDPARDEGVRNGRRLPPLTKTVGYGDVDGASYRRRAG